MQESVLSSAVAAPTRNLRTTVCKTEDTRSSASAQKPAFGNGTSALPCPRPCISSNATIELWQHVNRCQLRLGQGRGISRSKTHDALGAWSRWALKDTADREVRHGATCLQSQEPARVPPIGPCSVPCPACSYSKAQQRDLRTHGHGDQKGEVTQCMQPTGTASGGPLAQQWPMLRYDRPRIRMTWRTLARGSLGAGALAYVSASSLVLHRVQSAWLEFS
jgi:hypothetical protein